MNKTLVEMKKGQKAEIVELDGGHMMQRRLHGMGVRPGKTVTCISSQFMSGPITIEIDGRQTAMGRGIASRVRVNTEKHTDATALS